MNYLRILSKSIVIFFTFIVTVFGQGTIKGVIVDSNYGDALPGANVFIQGTSLGAATDINGLYRITNVPAGSHILEVIYIGYKSKQIPVEVDNNETITVNIEIDAEVIEGEAITITAQAEGQIAAINQQINSNTIVNVVSEEKIKELPDANAAEAIGRLPGVSITRTGGEASKVILRGMQDKFTAIYLDGVRVPATDPNSRGVDLSTISQSSLAGIELAKAITPDKDGDAMAGSIDLVSKKAPEEREINANVKGNYSNLTDDVGQYDLSFHYGERFFDNILGVQISGNIEQKDRSSERLDVNHARVENPLNPELSEFYISNLEVEFTDEIRKRNGMGLLLDINTPDDGVIRINNSFNSTNRDYLTHFRDYPSPRQSVADVTYDYRQREKDISTFSSSIRGDNHLYGFNVDWGVSFAESKAETPFDYELQFRESGSANGGMRQGYPDIFDRKEAPDKIIPLALNNFQNAPLDWAFYRDQDNYEKERTAYFNISKDYNLFDNISGEIKAGAKYKVKDRKNKTSEHYTPYYLDKYRNYEYVIVGNDTIIRPKDLTGTYFEEWDTTRQAGFIELYRFFGDVNSRDIYGKYKLTPLISRERLKQWQRINRHGINQTGFADPPRGDETEVWENPLIKTDDYNIDEHVSAFYIMNTLNIGQDLTFISGLRTEHEYNNYNALYVKGSIGGFPIPTNAFGDTSSFAEQTIYLPNFHLAYEATDYMKVRLAAYKTLARPDFNMRIDRKVSGRGDINTDFILDVGNINLKSAEAWNYEINTSFYNNNIGLLSLSVFYKEIENMYHTLDNFTGAKGDTILKQFNIDWKTGFRNNQGYDLTLPYNTKKPTKVWGVEFEHQINFHFLPGFLKNFVLSYNFSLIRSETQTYKSKQDSVWVPFPPPLDNLGAWEYFKVLDKGKTKLVDQPEAFGNIALGYDYAGFSGRVSLYHQAEYNSSYSANRYNIKMAFTRIDIALKQRILDNFSLFVNLANITNIEDGQLTYEYNTRRFDYSEKYGMTIDFGVLAEF